MRRNRLAVLAAACLAVSIPFAISGAFPSAASGGPSLTSPHTARPGSIHWMAKNSKYAGKSRCPAGPLCTEINKSPRGTYVGHDEPAVNFYSSKAGSGNNVTTTLTLPKDSTVKGAAKNFAQHIAFWFGMAMCDDQSAPNPGGSSIGPDKPCTPDSNSNIYTSTSSSNSKYIGLHPGLAFMEMQFYPPGFVDWPPGDSCSAHQWCAALNIDSLSENYNTGQVNNASCLNSVGIEPVNFAFITKNGVATGPANPVDATAGTVTPDPTHDLFMNSGDKIKLHEFDTSNGFEVSLQDLTTGQHGFMVASAANGFGHVNFDPNASACTVTDAAFHPAYSTSSTRTRVPWAAHSYNVGYSDEVGHFERCVSGAVTAEGGDCLESTADPEDSDPDDSYCFDSAASSLYKLSGCYGEDDDFDGTSYQKVWPGNSANHARDVAHHGTPVTFTPLQFNGGSGLTNYRRVSFEADLPRIESLTTPPCQRHVKNPTDPNPGQGCVGLPAGAHFYPFFSTHTVGGKCVWEEGGAHLPNTVNDFGGSSSAEFGNGLTHILGLAYPDTGGKIQVIYEDYRHILKNPCT